MGDSYAIVKDYAGTERSANIAFINSIGDAYTQSMFEGTTLYALKTLNSINYGFALGSSDTAVTSNDYGYTPLNSALTVKYLEDKSTIVYNTENHKVTVTRSWSLTNTDTVLSVEVKEILYFRYNGIAIWRELLNEQSFTLQPLQAGTFTMTLEYDLVDYTNPISSVNFLSEVI